MTKNHTISKKINVLVLRKTKIAYYLNLNVKNIVDNKKFWKTVKSFFSDKSDNFERIYFLLKMATCSSIILKLRKLLTF